MINDIIRLSNFLKKKKEYLIIYGLPFSNRNDIFVFHCKQYNKIDKCNNPIPIKKFMTFRINKFKCVSQIKIYLHIFNYR